MNETCPKCGGHMQAGANAAHDMSKAAADARKAALIFVLPGEPASWNPNATLERDFAAEPGDRSFVVQGMRCAKCGFLELYAGEECTG